MAVFGCARHAPRPATEVHADSANLAVYREYASRPASALAFSPPVIQDQPPLELSRDLRQPGAFMGYPEAVTEFFFVRWDDRQAGGDGFGYGVQGCGSGGRDLYERRAVSVKVGVLNR